MKQENGKNGFEPELDDGIDEQAAAWFVRLRAANVTRREKAAFFRWMDQDDAHRKMPQSQGTPRPSLNIPHQDPRFYPLNQSNPRAIF